MGRGAPGRREGGVLQEGRMAVMVNGTNGQCAWPSGEGGRRHFQVWTCQIRLSLLLHAKFNLCCVCSIDTLVHPESAVTVVESVFPVRVVTKDH